MRELREYLIATLIEHLGIRTLELEPTYLMNFSTATLADKTTVNNVGIVISGPRVSPRTTTGSYLTHHRAIRGRKGIVP